MAETLAYDEMARRLRAAADLIRADCDRLSELDRALGDGDHGTTMGRICAAITAGIDGHAGGDLAAMLSDMAWAVMGTDGGSASPLFGSLILGLADGVPGSELDSAGLAAAFAAGVAEMRNVTQAKQGEKTLMDALIPAVETLEAAAAEDVPPAEALQRAAAAAAAGAEATRDMKATQGRARNLGDRTIGHVDPGATSMALFFQGLAR